MKSGNLNFLEPSGPLQACNGTVPFKVLPQPVEASLMLTAVATCLVQCTELKKYVILL